MDPLTLSLIGGGSQLLGSLMKGSSTGGGGISQYDMLDPAARESRGLLMSQYKNLLAPDTTPEAAAYQRAQGVIQRRADMALPVVMRGIAERQARMSPMSSNGITQELQSQADLQNSLATQGQQADYDTRLADLYRQLRGQGVAGLQQSANWGSGIERVQNPETQNENGNFLGSLLSGGGALGSALGGSLMNQNFQSGESQKQRDFLQQLLGKTSAAGGAPSATSFVGAGAPSMSFFGKK